jgi:hypothetical protein
VDGCAGGDMMQITFQDFVKLTFTDFEEFYDGYPSSGLLPTDEYSFIDQSYDTEGHGYFFELWPQNDQPLFIISRAIPVSQPLSKPFIINKDMPISQPVSTDKVSSALVPCLEILFDKKGPDQLIFSSISGEERQNIPLSSRSIENVIKGIETITQHKKDFFFNSDLLKTGT